MATLLDPLIPTTGVPASWVQKDVDAPWLFHDNLARYQKQGPHPVYGEESIRYKTNSQGYRCPEFTETGELRIIAIGCSIVFGTGMAQEHLFHERFGEQLRQDSGKSVMVWNLSQPGASNDCLLRLLHLAVPRLDPQIVLIHFTFNTRREYLSAAGHLVNWFPAKEDEDPARREIHDHIRGLASQPDDTLNFFRNYMSAAALLRDRMWFFSCANPASLHAPALEYLDPAHYAGGMAKIDLARDFSHPGPDTHLQLYRQHWEKFVDSGEHARCLAG